MTANSKKKRNSNRQIFRFLLVAFFWSSLGYAQHSEIYSSVDSLNQYIKTDPKESMRYASEAFRLISEDSTFTNDSVKTFVVSQLAQLSYGYNEIQNAIRFGKMEVNLRQKLLGNDHLLYAVSLNNLGLYQYVAARYDSSLANLHLAEDILSEKLDACHPQRLSNHANLGYSLFRKQEVDSTLQYFQKVLDCEDAKESPLYINILESTAYLLVQKDSIRKAVDRFESLFSSYEEQGMDVPARKPQQLADYAKLVYQLGKYNSADSLYQVISEEGLLAKVEIDEIVFLEEQAEIKKQLDDDSAAVATYQNLIQKSSDIDKKPKYLNQLASLAKKNQDIEKAKSYFLRSYQIQDSLGIDLSDTYLFTLSGLSNVYTELGQYRDADELFSIFVELVESDSTDDGQDADSQAQLWQNYGTLKYNLGEYSTSEQYFLRARAILTDAGKENSIQYATLANNLGALYETMGNFGYSLMNYKDAESILKKKVGGLHDSYANTLSNLANTYIKIDSLDQAEELLQEVLSIRKQTIGMEHPLYAISVNNLAGVFEKRNATEKALSLYFESLRIKENTQGKHHPEYALAMNNIGNAYLTMGMYDSAEYYFLEAKQLQEEFLPETHPDYLLTINNLCSVYGASQNYIEAEPLIRYLASKKLEQIRYNFASLSEKEKSLFVRENEKFLDNFKKFALVRSGYTPSDQFQALEPQKDILKEWYDIELITKGMLLNSSVKVRQQILNSDNEDLIKTYEDWTRLRNQIALVNSMTLAERENSGYNLDSMQLKANAIEKELASLTSDLSGSIGSDDVTWNDIKANLDKNEAALELIRLPFDSLVLYVGLLITEKTEDHPELVVLRNGKELETKYLNYYKNVTNYREHDTISYQVFWSQIESQIPKAKKIERIYLSPDGVYHQISLNTLYNYREEDYLLDEMQIVQVTSTRDIPRIKETEQQPIASAHAHLFGRPQFAENQQNTPSYVPLKRGDLDLANIKDLPGTEKEVESINQTLKARGITTDLYLGSRATEDTMKTLTSPPILHVATHGLFIESDEDTDPMLQSGLVLSGATDYFLNSQGKTEDGIFTAYEVMNMPYDDTDLVVLSACNTGKGKVTSGEGVYGLQRAFKVAGVNTLIMSLWQVDDQATMELMTTFYSNLFEMQDKRAAFKSAQLAIREKYPHFYYWGAFVMIE